MRKHPTDLHLEAFLLDQGEERRRQRFKSLPPFRPVGIPGPEPIPPTPPLSSHRALGFAAALAQERSGV